MKNSICNTGFRRSNLNLIGLTPAILILGICHLLSFSAFGQYIPGNTYYDSTGFVEYRAGNLPIIISAPHGGSLEPDSISDRDCANCVTVKDAWTQTIAEGMHHAFIEQTGCYPHVIIILLHRKKFDANRDITEAANGNPTVERSWRGYHAFIDSAKNEIKLNYGRGLFLDLHGHGHQIQRIELGYLLSGSELRLSDSTLNSLAFREESSIRTLTEDNIQGDTHATLLRGTESFGTLMDDKGFPAVPSLTDPFPLVGDPYFSGGYNTQRHGSQDNDDGIDAIQIELNQEIRFDETNREQLIDSLTRTSNQYINFHYDNLYLNNFCDLVSNIEKIENQSEIIIFPNPVNNYFSLKTEIKDIEISVYNLLGQRLISERWEGRPITTIGLQSGCYILKMKKGTEDLGSLKLVKY